MKPVKITLEEHTSGDGWQGILTIGPVRCGPTGTDAMPVAAASARLWLTKSGSTTPSLKLASADAADFADADAPITVLDGADWHFTVPALAASVWTPAAGTYSGHFEVTDTAGTPLTIYDIYLTVGKDKTPVPTA